MASINRRAAPKISSARISRAQELNLRIKPRKRLKRDKPDELAIPMATNQPTRSFSKSEDYSPHLGWEN